MSKEIEIDSKLDEIRNTLKIINQELYLIMATSVACDYLSDGEIRNLQLSATIMQDLRIQLNNLC